MIDLERIIKTLKSKANPKKVAGMARFGISSKNTLGVAIPDLRSLAKQIEKDHNMAMQLWRSGIHEAKILASMVEEADKVTEEQMDEWVKDFDSWDVCDQVCLNLFCNSKSVLKKCRLWSANSREFVRRAAFALAACAAFKNKNLKDGDFVKIFPLIKKYSFDERNYVRKAVNWALRQIGKRNEFLNKEAIKAAEEIFEKNNKTARWIAADALRELKSAAVKKRLNSKK